jgi:CheY-like chemotaxis protein
LTAFNGLEAFNKFAEVSKTKSKVALVLIDCEMPIMDGIESTQKMREFERQHRLQPAFIVGLSGNWGHEFERKCKLNGMDQTYTKPLPMDTLSGIVN